MGEQIHCPVFKHKIHCSQLEGTEVCGLPEDRRYEFCLTKCPVYKRHKGHINQQLKKVAIIYQDRLLKVSKSPTEKGTKYKIEATDGRLYKSWEAYCDSDEEAIESAQREFRNFFK